LGTIGSSEAAASAFYKAALRLTVGALFIGS